MIQGIEIFKSYFTYNCIFNDFRFLEPILAVAFM